MSEEKQKPGTMALPDNQRLLRTKDLAAMMDLHPRTVKRWWRRLRVPPDVRGHCSHRWTPAGAARLLHRWQAYWRTTGRDAHTQARRYAGTFRGDESQLWLKF